MGIHHLRPDNDFDDLRKFIAEAARVLKPGGKLTINWSPPLHQRIGMWWAELIHRAQRTWEDKSPSKQKMKEILESCGFADVHFEMLYDSILYNEKVYSDPVYFFGEGNGVLSDSTFQLATKEELEAAKAMV